METPIVIEHRHALIYMLCEAAELEHAIACQYLFAGFSLKRTMEEGLDERQLRAVAKWHQMLSGVAVQEMMHLAQVNNLLISIGAAPRVGRPNLPARGRHYPPQVQFALLPFGERALRHFLFLERPENIHLKDAEGFEALEEAEPILSEEDIVPRPQDFSTVGHLYHSIEEGFRRLTERHGEAWLFVGPRHAQATAKIFRWPELVAVHDLATARQGIEMIVEQGEGPRGHWRDAHYGRFLEILGEYLTFKRENPAFEPARPVIPCNVRRPVDTEPSTLVSEKLTAHVLDAFNVAYEVMLQCLARFFGKGNETEAQHRGLADLAVELMIYVLKPLGELVTTMPVGAEHPGKTAGPSFELFFASGYLLPHHRSAFVLLHERLM
ncbi:MAG: ferritin-like domain-containing protein, partial [Actinomycetota bacterium]